MVESQRILCLGDSSVDTDGRCRDLAKEWQLPCHGLITDGDHDISRAGVYHTTLIDMAPSQIRQIAPGFDRVIMLGQNQYRDLDLFLRTAGLTREIGGEFEDSALVARLDYWHDLLITNKSFCILPWIEYMVRGDATTLCCRSAAAVSHDLSLQDFSQHPDYIPLRQAMLQGVPLPEHCGFCYQQEQQGFVSGRQRETTEWANRLCLNSVADLDHIGQPVYYEMRASNRCNLKCRTCSPELSLPIAQEYRRLGLITQVQEINNNQFDKINFQSLQRLYVAGGEPLFMPEFLEFLERCVEQNHTGFDLLINTNGTVIPGRIRTLLGHFRSVQFIFSIDGIGAINDYIRSNSRWQDIVDNWRWAAEHHLASVNTTVSVYNIARLHEIMQFIDAEFPGTVINLQTAQAPGDIMNPDLHPDRDLVIQNLRQCQLTRCYNDNAQAAAWINAFLRQIEPKSKPDQLRWIQFQARNSLLDQHRGTNVQGVLPDLAGRDK